MAACTSSGDHDIDTARALPRSTQPQAPPSPGLEADPDPEGAARSRVGVVFDPSRVKPGDSIAGLVVERIDASPTVVDSTLVGSIAFRGEMELAGHTVRHPEADASCLESWNATFIFDASEQTPRLAAAVYDQWEW